MDWDHFQSITVAPCFAQLIDRTGSELYHIPSLTPIVRYLPSELGQGFCGGVKIGVVNREIL